jgi:glycosyltransferase involved in cell wall biosynthesis
MTKRTRTPASHTGTAEVDLDEETVLLVDDPATWPKGERAVRTLVAMPAYNEEAYIAKTVVGAPGTRIKSWSSTTARRTRPSRSPRRSGRSLSGMRPTRATAGRSGRSFRPPGTSAPRSSSSSTDGQHDPADIPRLLTELRAGNDVVLPSADPESGFGAYGKKAIEAVLAGGAFDAGVLVADPGLKVAGVRSGSPAAEPRYRGKRIAVVVPAYNEEDLIGETLDGIPDYVAKVYVVDDGSADMTGAIIEDYAHRDPRIVAIHHNPNRGVGAAITTGYLQAVEDGMDIAAVMAGDNQMDPAYLPDLLDPIVDGRADYTKGNRLINQAYRKGMPPWRSFGNSLLTFLTKVASGYWQMMDPQNGYTAVSTRALAELPLDSVYQGYGYCNNLLIWLNIHNMTVRTSRSRPATAARSRRSATRPTSPGSLKLLLGNFLFRLKTKYIQMGFHPLAFFYAAGAVLTPIGVIGGLVALWEKFVMGYPVLFVHGVLSFLVFMMGMQFLFFAMLFDMQANTLR